ncbi:MAG: GNAT family N-acetyltransferase [Bacteroidia bacterium]
MNSTEIYPLIQTSRLILRPMVEADARHMFDMNNDPDVVRFTGNKAYENIEEVLNYIRTNDQFEKYKLGRFTILDKITGEYIGWCGLKFLEDINEIDLGYRLLKKNWGKGIATESSIAMLDYGFLTLGLERIVGRAVKENINSIHILQKLGMTYEKEFEAHGYLCVQYVLDKKMWITGKNS